MDFYVDFKGKPTILIGFLKTYHRLTGAPVPTWLSLGPPPLYTLVALHPCFLLFYTNLSRPVNELYKVEYGQH